MQIRRLYIDLDVIHGVTGVQAVFFLLKQNLLRRAEHGGMILCFQFCCGRRCRCCAALFDGVMDIAGLLSLLEALSPQATCTLELTQDRPSLDWLVEKHLLE